MLDQSAQPCLALAPALACDIAPGRSELGCRRALGAASRPVPPRPPMQGQAPTAIWLNAEAFPAGAVLRGAGLAAVHLAHRRNGSPLLLHHTPDEAWLAVLDLAAGTLGIHDLARGWHDAMAAPFDRLYVNLPRRVLGGAGLRALPGPGPADAVALALGTALADRPRAAQLEGLLLAMRAHLAEAYAPLPQALPQAPAPAASPGRGGLAPWQLRKAKAMIEARVESGVGVEEIARECRLSRSYFSRAFKHSTGVPPHAWLAACRIEKAKRLLAESGTRIADVAAECGFADQSHLTRSFAARLGITPAAWRRQARAGEARASAEGDDPSSRRRRFRDGAAPTNA